MTVPENTTRPADPDVCDYRIQGTEFDPIFGPGERENFVSLQYVLKRLLPNPTLISEDFNSGSWNSGNFEIGSPTGGVVNGAETETPGQGQNEVEEALNVRVHQAISPNGDGRNDGLIIEGIKDYPSNQVTVFDLNGIIRWQAKGYDNTNISFNGKDQSGRILAHGTSYVMVEINDGGVWKIRKTFIVIR